MMRSVRVVPFVNVEMNACLQVERFVIGLRDKSYHRSAISSCNPNSREFPSDKFSGYTFFSRNSS